MGIDRLNKANIRLGLELWTIKSCLDTYRLINLNAEAISDGRGGRFLFFIEKQSIVSSALGLAKVFEKFERNDAGKLGSVRGVYQLAQHEQIQDIAAAQAFVGPYGIIASEDWLRDVDQVFSVRKPWVRSHMKDIEWARNTQLAHMQQGVPMSPLPPFPAFKELLDFALEFHAFVNAAFLDAVAHPILAYQEIASSLLTILKKLGVSDPVLQFEDI